MRSRPTAASAPKLVRDEKAKKEEEAKAKIAEFKKSLKGVKTEKDIVRALEDAGFAVDPASAGVAYFETGGVERLYGGLEPALKRALTAVGTEWDARVGAAGRRFAALAAASVARPGQVVVVADEELPQFLAPLPLTLLPLDRNRYEELEALDRASVPSVM